MPFYPNLYNVDRGDIKQTQYAGDYSIPLVDNKDYDSLFETSVKLRDEKVKNSEDLFKKLNLIKSKGGFTNPDLQAEDERLKEEFKVNSASISAAINGGPYLTRKLEGDFYNYSNSAKYWELQKQENQYQQFRKEAEKIKDPNFKQQAFAAANAYATGQVDPVTGKKLTAFELNLGEYAPMDLDKEINAGLDNLITRNEVIEERNGMQQTIKKIKIDPKAANDFLTIYQANPAVQRNLYARGLGTTIYNEKTGNMDFHINDKGKLWMDNILTAKTTPVDDVQGVRFNTKAYNEQAIHGGTGAVTDNIATGSTSSDEGIKREGDQNVKRRISEFDEDLFRKQVAVQLKDPAFRKKMVDQGFLNEDGSYTTSFSEQIDIYKKKGHQNKITGNKNVARESTATGKGSKAGQGKAILRSAFDEAGLDLINVGGLDLTKKVNYRVIQGKDGKYWLRVGTTPDNDIPLSEGKHYNRKNVPKKGPEPWALSQFSKLEKAAPVKPAPAKASTVKPAPANTGLIYMK